MNIPKKVKIGGQVYKVTREWRNDPSGTMGNAFIFANQIVVNENQDESQVESTLLHEILEVINSQHDWNLDHCIISQLEAALYQVLTDNDLA